MPKTHSCSACKGCWLPCPQNFKHVEIDALWHVQRTVDTISCIVMVAHLMRSGSLVCSKSFCDDVQQEMLLHLQLFAHVNFITQTPPRLITCLMQAFAISISNCLQKNLETYTARFACSLYDVLWESQVLLYLHQHRADCKYSMYRDSLTEQQMPSKQQQAHSLGV